MGKQCAKGQVLFLFIRVNRTVVREAMFPDSNQSAIRANGQISLVMLVNGKTII